MSDTPRNDKLTAQAVGCSDALHLVLVDELSRNLERELAEVRKHLRDANRGAEVNAKVNQLLVEDLAEVRRQVDALAITLSRLSTGLTPEEWREWAAQQAKEGGGK